MTTARTMITRSLRSLGVLHSGETPSAEEANDGLVALNEMLSAWIHDGIDMEYVTLATLDDVLPYPLDHEGPLRYNLAIWMSAEYGVSVDAVLGTMAQQGYDRMRRQYLDRRQLKIDPALTERYDRRIFP